MQSMKRRLFALAALAALFVVVAAVPSSAARATAGDTVRTAFKITALPYSAGLETTAFTADADEPSGTCGGLGGQTVWFKYTPRTAGTLHADTIGSYLNGTTSVYDTVLQVWAKTGGALTAVVCDDDGGSYNTSSLSFSAEAHTTYYFQVGGYSGNVYTGTNYPVLSFHLSAE